MLGCMNGRGRVVYSRHSYGFSCVTGEGRLPGRQQRLSGSGCQGQVRAAGEEGGEEGEDGREGGWEGEGLAQLLIRIFGKGGVQTKPHGHGDVHVLLHQSGLLAKW